MLILKASVATVFVAAMVPTAMTADGAYDFAGAKWIGANPVTLPDYDFGSAVWIAPQSNETALTKTVVLPEKPETAELVVVAHGWFSVEINGMKSWGGACRDLAPCGDFHDWRYAKFVDAAPALREGTNTFRIATKAAKGEDAAVLLSVMLPDGTRIATDGSWDGARLLGGPREVPWGREMVFRREVNSPRFRKSFALPDSVASARLSITGLGYYEATINGARVGRKRLDPIPSNYDKLVYYSTYDVAGMLRKGENVIDVTLGHGWYDVRAVATWNWDMAPWRSPPKMIARLDVVTRSGDRIAVLSDETWRQVESPVGFDCIREGEVIGARNKRAVDLERNVVNAVEVPAPKGRLEEETVPPTVAKRTVAVKSIDPVDGWWRIDFGEDIAGFMRMRFSDAVAGRTVVFRYDERDGVMVDPVDKRDGVASAASAKPQRRIDCHFGWTASHDVVPGGVFQCDRYVTKGEEGEVYEPRFTYSGFRYVFVKGLGRAPKADECEAVVLQTDFQDIGSFSCSSPVFNGLVRMADRAYKSNFVNGFPTDCPHREKNGWTADAALAGEMAMYCYENTIAYKAWLRQVADSQRGDGWISEIVPTAGWGYHGLLDWDAVIAILPMDIYRYRGDAGALEEMYPTLTNYLEKAAIPFLDNGVFRRVRGDWLTAGTLPDEGIVGTCYFKLMCETAAFTARRLDDSAAAARYASYADAARLAFNRVYYRGNGVYGDSRGRQTTQGMALSFGMVPDSERKAVQAELVKAVEAADGHLDFGLHGMKWVPRALSEAGRSDLVFRMFTNETAPSPATWLKRGGTSLWEDWVNGASRNHIMFGDFVCWAYQYLAGIRLAGDSTAFRRVLIAPDFIDGLDWAKASVSLPGGQLSSSWKRRGGKVKLHVEIPEGTHAVVRIRGRADEEIGPGSRDFAVETTIADGTSRAISTARSPTGNYGETPF
jgi:alpha-L-rhamnosidase